MKKKSGFKEVNPPYPEPHRRKKQGKIHLPAKPHAMLLWHPIPLPLELTHTVHILDVCGVLPTSWPQGLQKSLQGTVRNRSLTDRSELKHKKKCGGRGYRHIHHTWTEAHAHTHSTFCEGSFRCSASSDRSQERLCCSSWLSCTTASEPRQVQVHS